MRRVFFLLTNALLLLSTTWNVQASPEITNYLVNYEETPKAFIDYPKDEAVQSAIHDHDGDIKPVKVEYWSDVTHFGNPALHLVKGIVRRLDKYLITFQPLFLVTDGKTRGCRIAYEDGSEEVNFKDTHCQNNCTNYGRYCATKTPSDPNLAARISGRAMVTEQFRRMCVWLVYGKSGEDNSEQYWNYVTDMYFEQCEEPFGFECVHEVMQSVGIGEGFIHNCMEHVHGTDTDEDNPYMETCMSSQKQLTPPDLPVFRMSDTLYIGEYTTGAIFQRICELYEDKKPVACEFCRNCSDVRRCLWFLECDDKKFDDYVQTIMPPPPVDIAATIVPIAGNDTASSSGNNNIIVNQQALTSSSASGATSTLARQKEVHVLRGLAAGLVIGVVIAAVFAYRDWKTKETLRSIVRAADVHNTRYTDDDEEDLDLADVDINDPPHARNGSSSALPSLS